MDYSIIVCTYNPDEGILRRCLDAIYQLDRTGLSAEVIIVDNNSMVPLRELTYVREYLEKIPSTKTIYVEKQGVKFARMAAIEQSVGKYIVYFDYDNEPYSDYLQVLKLLNEKFLEVAAWGPGNVWVDFLDGVEQDIQSYAKVAFQERHDTETRYASEMEWQSCYPFGTGLCTRSDLLKEYVTRAKMGEFTLAGRSGNKLTSGEDTQMVLLCIRNGYSAGVSPGLKIKHMIPGSRANSSYLERLAYGTSVCYDTCLVQVFPEKLDSLQRRIMPSGKFARKAFKKFVATKFRRDPQYRFELATFLGVNAGVYLALHEPPPALVNYLIRQMKLE